MLVCEVVGRGSDGVCAKAWALEAWGVALTECVQMCWILRVCGFEKSLVEAGLA